LSGLQRLPVAVWRVGCGGWFMGWFLCLLGLVVRGFVGCACVVLLLLLPLAFVGGLRRFRLALVTLRVLVVLWFGWVVF
jgi:hypothetical protein